MKKSLLSIAILALFTSPLLAVDDNDETAWFDMMNCGICKNMQPIMPHMQKMKWDSKPTKHGLVTITVVPEELRSQWVKCKSSMDAAVKELEGGKEMKCCGFCKSFGSLIEAGAMKEEIKTAGGDIMLLTSTNPKVVEKIHNHVKKTLVEHEKMAKMMEQMQGSHQSHDDDSHDEHGADHDHGGEHDGVR